MNVEQLREALADFPDHTEVVIHGSPITEVRDQTVVRRGRDPRTGASVQDGFVVVVLL